MLVHWLGYVGNLVTKLFLETNQIEKALFMGYCGIGIVGKE